MVMIRHYGAVLKAVFHSYTDIWLLCSITEVEHTADDKQTLCLQQRDGYICVYIYTYTYIHTYTHTPPILYYKTS